MGVRRARLASLAFLLPSALAWLSGCPEGLAPMVEDAGPPPIASLVLVEGHVSVERGAQAALPGRPGILLASEDVVVTGPASTALVRYLTGQEVEVSERTRFRLRATAGELEVELEEGRIVTRGGTDGGVGRLALRAAGAQMLLEMGDVVDVTARSGSGSSSLQVEEGEITVVSVDGGTVAVARGQQASFEMGEIRLATPKPPPAAPTPIPVVLTAERGRTLLRGAKDRAFRPAQGPPVALQDGTQFQLARGARALLAAPRGLRARLIAASGRLESAVLEGLAERYTFGLEAGEVQLHFEGGAARTVQVKGRGKVLEVQASEAASATLVQTGKGPRLSVLAGQVKVGGGASAVEVGAGQAVDLAPSGAPRVVSRGRPPLVLPARRVRVYADVLPEVGLALPDGASMVEVAQDAAFTQVVARGRVQGDSVQLPPPAQGDLHWRALDAQGEPLARGHARFDQDPDATIEDLEHPRAEVTETGLKAVVYFQSALPEISFVYPAREGADRYRLRVYRAGDLQQPLWEGMETGIRATVPAGKIGEGEYLWYAAPLGPDGTELQGGRMNRLEMVYDNSRRSLAISRPRQGERVQRQIQARGIAPIGSKLSVNGRPAPLDGKGRFDLEVPASPFVVFRLVTDDGGESYWVRQVRSRP
jgi:hypothetical protein